MATTGRRRHPKMRESIERLQNERDRILVEIEQLRHKASGIELSISLLMKEDGEVPTADADMTKRGNAKALLLDLLREAGTTGLNSNNAVDIAARRGIKLKRGTAASNLSRLKADGAVVLDNGKYRLPEFVRQPTFATIAGGKS